MGKIRAPRSPINPGTRRKPSLFRLGVRALLKLWKIGRYQIIFWDLCGLLDEERGGTTRIPIEYI